MGRPSRWPLPVALAGWRGAYVVPCLSLLAGVLLLGRWLQQEGRSPLFALLLLGYLPNLVMGRVAMSDVPSLFLVILGLWLFWRGSGRSWRWWLASGFVAGGSMLFRESNPIPFAPFFAGALLRRERNVWALVVGGIAGLALRVGANAYFLDQPLHYRSAYILALGTMPGAPADLRSGAARLRAGGARAGAPLSRAALAGALHRGGGLRDGLPDPDVLHVHDVADQEHGGDAALRDPDRARDRLRHGGVRPPSLASLARGGSARSP